MGGYTHNPDPQPDPAPSYARYRPDQGFYHSEHAGDQSTEFSWGPGPVAPHLNGRPPSEGGVYMPRSPRVDPPLNAERVGRPRTHPRPLNEARGYPGEIIG